MLIYQNVHGHVICELLCSNNSTMRIKKGILFDRLLNEGF